MTTKGRKAQPPAEIKGPQFIPNTLPEVAQTMEIMSTVAANYSEERDLVNQMLGQIQMARSFSKFADVVSLTKLRHIKENKTYRAIAGQKAHDFDGNEIADVGTWDGFCQALGLSRSKIDEDITNLDAFGEDALKQLSAVGAGYRELRQYRKLPADEKLALIEAAKSGDKDGLLDLAETLIARHAKEKETLTAELEEVKATADSRKIVIDDKAATISQLQEKLAGKKPEPAKTPEFLAEQALRDIDDEALACVGALMSLRSKFVAADNVEADMHLVVQAQRAAVGRVLAAINHLADDYQIATTGLKAAPEAVDEAAEDAEIWGMVNAELAAGSSHDSTH